MAGDRFRYFGRRPHYRFGNQPMEHEDRGFFSESLKILFRVARLDAGRPGD